MNRITRPELIGNASFINAQYGDLPVDEKPLKGPIIDVTGSLRLNKLEEGLIDNVVRTKRLKTIAWSRSRRPAEVPIFLTRPFFWKNSPPEVQEKIAQYMAEIILAVYGAGYPLPNKTPDFNLQGLKNGSLLPYIGLMGPNSIHNGEIFEHPELLLDGGFTPVATSAIVLSKEGFAELGRTASRGIKEPDYGGFEGGALVLERVYDWLRNRHRLLEVAHALKSDIRAARQHDESPSSGSIQSLILGDLGMKIKIAAPLYNVNGLEPFLSVTRPRNQEDWRAHNANKTIFTTEGNHLGFLKELWKHQIGLDANIVTVPKESLAESYHSAVPTYNGDAIYSSVDVVDGKTTSSIAKVTSELEPVAPVVLVKIEAESPRSAATQAALVRQGYTICGIEPGYDQDYLDPNGGKENGEYELKHYRSPAYVYLVKLGQPVVSGQTPIAEAYYPTPEEANGKELHGERLRQFLYQVDSNIRNSVGL